MASPENSYSREYVRFLVTKKKKLLKDSHKEKWHRKRLSAVCLRSEVFVKCFPMHCRLFCCSFITSFPCLAQFSLGIMHKVLHIAAKRAHVYVWLKLFFVFWGILRYLLNVFPTTRDYQGVASSILTPGKDSFTTAAYCGAEMENRCTYCSVTSYTFSYDNIFVAEYFVPSSSV